MTNNRIPIERWKDWTRKLPYGKIGVGYKVNPDDAHHVIPDEDQIVIIEQAFDYIDAGSSLREVSEWLSQKMLRPVTHQTVSNMYKNHRKPFLNRKTNRKILNGNRKRSKEAIEKANAKRAITVARKKYNSLEGKYADKKLKPEDFPVAPPENNRVSNLPHLKTNDGNIQIPKMDKDIEIIFKPNPGPQTDFLSSTEMDVLFGGAAGGEPKTWFSASFPSNRSK